MLLVESGEINPSYGSDYNKNTKKKIYIFDQKRMPYQWR